MTPKQRSKLIATRNAKIKVLQQEIADLRAACPHVHLVYEAGGSSGGWDREDNYWYIWKCLDCGHTWETPQSGHYSETRKARKVESVRAKPLKFEDTRDPWNDI